MSPPRDPRAAHAGIRVLLIALLALAGLLGLAPAADATIPVLGRCLNTSPTEPADLQAYYYTDGPGPFGTSRLTIDTGQPASSMSRWMTKTTQIAGEACIPTRLGGSSLTVVAKMRWAGVDHGYAQVVLTYWDAQVRYISSASSDQLVGTQDYFSEVFAGGSMPAATKYVRVEFRLTGSGRVDVQSFDGYLTPPVITGVAKVGQLLTAVGGQAYREWVPPDWYYWQWLRCDASGQNCELIPAAGGYWGSPWNPTPWAYTVREQDFGSTLRVQTAYEYWDAYWSGWAISNPTAVVLDGGDHELAPDPDLEADPAGLYFTDGSGSFGWATDQSHSSTHSLKITSATSTLARWLTQTRAIAVVPGSPYTVSVWLKTLGAAANGFLSVNFWTASGSYIPATVDSPRLVGTQDWTQRTVHVTAPAAAAFLRIEYRLNGPGTLWADDLSVTAS